MRIKKRGRGGRTALAVALSALLSATIAWAGTGCTTVSQAQAQAQAPASTATPGRDATAVTVNAAQEPIGAITDHYVGLSFESGTLNSGYFDNVGNLTQLLKNLGSSVMRFGGLTVDGPTYTGITPKALAGLVRLADASNWTVLYSENLGNYSGPAVTADAQAVAAALGPKLTGIACGNEPDGFVRDGWRPSTYTDTDYLKEAATCLAAVRRGAPNAPLEGADLTGAANWLAPYAAQETGQLTRIGQHLYPAGCVRNYTGETARQADARLLSPSTLAEEVNTFKFAAADAKIAKARLLMSETNSICSGGLAGVSDSFAAALWAIDYMLTGAEHGVYGMNFHDRFLTNCTPYSPLCPPASGRSTGWTVRPIYYGMVFTHLLGSGTLLPVTLSTLPRSDYVKAFALKPSTGGGLRILMENMTYVRANVTLSVGIHTKSVTVLHLTAPGLTAKSGVRIQGAAVAANGTIKPGAPTVIKCSSGKCQVPIAPYTAVLVKTP